MSKHFHDARYYLGRAVDHTTAGVKEELEPVAERARELAGVEQEPDPSRRESIRADLVETGKRAAETAREAAASLRETVRGSRGDGDAA
ncbi:hypothetical protein SAMN05192561_1143 [Halopenitus malekzadehii]|uniref:Uncharacterized protein n=1 Tax=Halopenitus malekzadehii TaxID=1267564 RepID=A0A1H6JRZ0_9EURY|nr:hypothetical protein [Halopenitus malekzadehii]SEH62093.1 hypothetical protein SAMN05192561_1143 [Halopenitus malekzadehii]